MNKCQKKAFPKHDVWVKLTTVLPYECKKSTFIFYLARYCYKMLSQLLYEFLFSARNIKDHQ